MHNETKIFLNKDVYVIWHENFGMTWFLENVFAKFPGVTIKQSVDIVDHLKAGTTKRKLESIFEAVRIEESFKVIQSLIKEKFLNVQGNVFSKLSKIKQVPLCDMLSSNGEDFFSGLVIANHWFWYFPKPLKIIRIKSVLRRELGQLCLTEDAQMFRVMSCNGGRHLFPDQETRVDVANCNSINPIRVDLMRGSIQHIYNSAETLFDLYIGPGKVIDFIVKSNIELPFSMYFAKYSDPDEYDVRPHLDCWACGRDEKDNVARIKAIAEAVERYASSLILLDSTWISYNEIDSTIHPNDLIQISSKRLSKIKWLTEFDESCKYLWVNGYEYSTRKSVKILSDLVYYPYYPPYPSVFTANSTGVATHQSVNLAIESAVLELIERDAFIVHWLLKKSPNKINKKSLPTEFISYLKWLKVNMSSFDLLELRIDSIPVFGGIAIKKDVGLWVSAAADCNPKKAITKVLQELIASAATKSDTTSICITPDKIKRVADHEVLYRSGEAQKHAMFLMGGDERSWSDIIKNHKQVKSAVDFLKKISPLYIVPLQCYNKTALISEKLFTVRVLSPYLVPFYFAEDFIPDASTRLKDIQKLWGSYSLNLYPHPFA